MWNGLLAKVDREGLWRMRGEAATNLEVRRRGNIRRGHSGVEPARSLGVVRQSPVA
jgi:hypothetical protein